MEAAGGRWVLSICMLASEYCKELEGSIASLCVNKYMKYHFGKDL